MMFERYLSTPFWLKADADMDGVRLPAIRERLGQLYEGKGSAAKAIENYRAFTSRCGRVPTRSCSHVWQMQSGGSRASRTRRNRGTDFLVILG